MDVIASANFVGQEIAFLDNERFAHLSARGLFVYDTAKGPREIVWRHDQGFQCFAVDWESGTTVYAGQLSSDSLEVVKTSEPHQSTFIQNPCKAAIIDLAVSREAEKLYGLSGNTDHKLTVWSLSKVPKLLVSQKLEIVCKKILVNPVDGNLACVYGADGFRLVSLHEVFGHISLKFSAVCSVRGSDGNRSADLFDGDI
eukprot:gene47084-57660_t